MPDLNSVSPVFDDSTSGASSRVHHVLSGRQLGYAEFGSPKGRPVFYFHGFPASRYEALDMVEMAEEKGIRLICPDRPGAGLSALRPPSDNSKLPFKQLSLLDCAEDILSLADHLNLETFSILGYSAGGPLALACAYSPLFPPERLTAIGVLAGAGPWVVDNPSPPVMTPSEDDDPSPLHRIYTESELRQGILWREYLICFGVWFVPTITKFVITILVAIARFILWIGGISGRAETTLEENSPAVILAAFDQGAEGVIYIARQWLSDWGFRISDVKKGDRMRIWHGTEDVNVPILQARYIAQRIPGVRYREVKADHMGIRRYLGEMLDELVGETTHEGGRAL